MHCNITGPSRIHLQPSVHSIRPLPSGTKALNRKRLLTHDDKGKIYAKGMFTLLGDKMSAEFNRMAFCVIYGCDRTRK